MVKKHKKNNKKTQKRTQRSKKPAYRAGRRVVRVAKKSKARAKKVVKVVKEKREKKALHVMKRVTSKLTGKKEHSKVESLITLGRERGYITYDEILREFPTIEDNVF